MGKLGIWDFFSEQGRDLPLPRESVNGKTVVIAGANVGLGLEASAHVANKKPSLVIATCRDAVKCERTLKLLRERCAGTQPASLDSWPLELSSFDNVRSFADRFDAEGPERLNVFVANAGTFKPVYTRTQDDWEIMLQVNYLSIALLSILLLPHLLHSATCEDPSRLVLVSSLGHYLAEPVLTGSQNWDHVLGTISAENFGAYGMSRYNLSKMLQVAFVRELAARLPSPTPLVITAVDPGLCHSYLQRELEKYCLLRIVLAFVKWLLRARTSEMGSRTLVYAALATNAQNLHGKYMSSCEVVEECDFLLSAEGKAFSERLWWETIEVLSKVDDRVSQIVSTYLPAR
ncbi:NAD(P)-binding protein [Suillus subaureus]|uniref:NAD(P)-binding protein n=1 Tax=Suillus subaureus TaxID=48587 RepID=A0A9P7E668_9AGAM|nr:NAD(P)-binding protein [Suillus subaureus]KAG1812234.1 NAD(P)-binding protein [Suillus subaureus]